MYNIIYHNNYGFGKVLSDNSISSTIYFYNGEEKTVLNEYLKNVDDDLINSFVTGRIFNGFSYATEARGRDYKENGRVLNIRYNNNELIAYVKGTSSYKSSVRINENRSISKTCNCPVGYNCKHVYAEISEFKDILDSLLNYSNITSNITLSDNLKNNINAYLSNPDINSLPQLLIAEELANKDYKYLREAIKYAGNNKKNTGDLVNLFSSLSYNKSIHQMLNNNIRFFVSFSDGKTFLNIDDNLRSPRRRRYYYDYDDPYEYDPVKDRIFNFDYFEAIQLIEDHSNYSYTYKVYFSKIIETLKDNKDFIDYLKDIGEYNSSALNYFKEIIDGLNEEDRYEIILNSADNFKIEFAELNNYSQDKRDKLLSKVKITPDNFDFIYSRLVGTNDSLSRKEFSPIINLYETAEYDERQLIINKVNESGNRLIGRYLKHYNDDYYDNPFYSSYTHNLIPLETVKINKNDKDELLKFFVVDYSFHKAKGYEYTDITLKDPCDREALEFWIVDNYIQPKVNHLHSTKTQIYETIVYSILLEEKGEELKQATLAFHKQIETEKNLERCKAALTDMDSIQIINRNKSLINHKNRRAHLDVSIYLDGNEYRRHTISLKVGIDKMYVIKNLRDFIDRFINKETFKYGKDLELTHTLENFEDDDAKIINFLSLANHPGFYAKELIINDHVIMELLKVLKGRCITLNNDKVRIVLDDIKGRIILDNKYRFKCEYPVNNYIIINLDNELLLLDKDKNELNKIDTPDYNFMKFASKYNGIDIKPILSQFKKQFYSRYSQMIEVSDDLKEEFGNETLTIKAFFDYQDKAITVNTKYFIKDAETEIAKIKDENSIQKIDVYNDIITSLGFNNGVMEDDTDILSFFNMDFKFLKNYCEVYLSESIKNKSVTLFKPSLIRIEHKSTVMQAFMEHSEFSDDELYEILKGIRKKKKYILLSGDRVINISDEEATKFLELVDDLKLDKENLSKAKDITIAQCLKACISEQGIEQDEYLSNMLKDIREFKSAKYEVPQINGQLRKYQEEGYKWLKTLTRYNAGGILADDMGLGKTIQVITLIKSDKTNKPNIIVCPKSLVFNWKSEFMRFAQDEEVVEIYGNTKQRADLINSINNKKKCTYITAYDSLRNDIDLYKQKFNFLIIDEAQYIKNVVALKTLSVKKLKADHCFALTGTPIENNIVDLWSIFDFVMPGYLGKLDEIKSSAESKSAQDLIAKRIAPFVLRRTKEKVLKDLPDKYERVISAEMSKNQRKLYDAHVKAANDILKTSGKAFDVLPYLMRLRQICVEPSMFVENYKGDSCKIETVSNLIDEYIANGHKILIFSQFVKALNSIEKILKDKGISYFMITGETNARKRLEYADKFNSSDDEKIMLISLKAGGTGLNLIGADTVIHLDPWWNIAAENQASDRTHRIGQTKNVEVIKLICEDSIEQRVLELQNIKKDLIDRVISNDDSSITNATLEDIKYILG